MDTVERQIYRFEDVEVDVVRGNLRRSGEDRHLRQKTFQVLVYLIEHRGSDISKDQIIHDVWKDTAVVDDVLVQSIKDIRRALGDDTHRPRFVRTIPKLGYRFIGEVEEEGEKELVGNGSWRLAENRKLRIEGQRTKDKGQNTNSKSAIRSRIILISILAFVVISIVLGFAGQSLWQAEPQSAEVRLPQTPGKKTLVVMFFENQSNSTELDWLREGLADMLIADLSRSPNLTVLSRGQLHVLLERAKLDSAGKIGLNAALDIARRTGAEAVITGSFARLGNSVRLDVQIYDAKTGELNAAESLTVERAEQILTEIDLLSMKLANRLGGGEGGQEKTPGLAQVMTDNLEAYRYYSLAVEKAQALHNKEAIELLEKAIALDPEFAMAHARIGYAYAVTWGLTEKGKPHLEKAFQLSERLTEKDRLNIAGWYAIANLDYSSAIEQFRQIIARYPLEIEAYHRLARLLIGEGQTEETINILRKGLTIDPEAKNLYNGLGGVLSVLGQHDEAIAAHQRYVALANNEPNALDSLGATYQWAGNYDAAIANFVLALEIDPGFEVALIHLANARVQIGQYREAIDLYQRYIKNAPSDVERARGYRSLAILYLKKRDLDLAEKAANEVMKMRVEWAWTSAVIAFERGDFSKAKRLEERILSNFSLGGRGGKNSRRTEFYYRGYSALKKGLSAEAIANFQEAIRHLPQPWEIDAYEDCLANAYLELGRFDEAIAEYERILQLNPNYPLARFHLAQSFGRKNMTDEARHSYQLFLKGWKDADADIPEVQAAKHFIENSG